MQPISNIQYALTHVYFAGRHFLLEGKFAVRFEDSNQSTSRSDQSCRGEEQKFLHVSHRVSDQRFDVFAVAFF